MEQKLFRVNELFSNEDATIRIQQFFSDILKHVEIAYELAFGPETSIEDRRKLLDILAPVVVQHIADNVIGVGITSTDEPNSSVSENDSSSVEEDPNSQR